MGYGKFGEGPRFVIDAYREVLERHGLQPHTLEGHPFVRWRSEAWVRLEGAPVGILLGATRVVAMELSAVCTAM